MVDSLGGETSKFFFEGKKSPLLGRDDPSLVDSIQSYIQMAGKKLPTIKIIYFEGDDIFLTR